ncbi:low molecular weight protein-tyrosine-phosphatase [Luteibaculum oceani]|uniref:Low molecular weight phosphotyrosine protein phosphatase n=1 Tax=Luteibaculum oceani TaxID=1294296 RepID=A0A5C6US58_9FLAO|nr:low molecular weight protein-tyrosine-phosphatase [Luteibaculum oceani]TXC76163.1 low molecular weight phosphotyrosine protein phosphatase [Luteibaculum oceani]
MTKVLFVCLGNICRSPLAEGILRSMAQQKGVDLEIDSCGTSNYHVGEQPDIRSIEVAKKHGIDISDLRGRQFTTSDFNKFDFIFVMDQSNYQNVVRLANSDEERNKVQLFLDYAPSYSNKEVPDPYYGGDEGFENVYRMLNEASENFLQSI